MDQFEKSLLPCCNNCTSSAPFQQVAHLENVGVTILRYVADIMNQVPGLQVVKSRTSHSYETSNNVFIIINTNDTKITSKDILPEVDINKVACPRCRYRMENVKKLLGSKIDVDKGETKIICDHCRAKQLKEVPCAICKDIVKKFLESSCDHYNKSLLKYEPELLMPHLRHPSTQITEADEVHRLVKEKPKTAAAVVPSDLDMKLKLIMQPTELFKPVKIPKQIKPAKKPTFVDKKETPKIVAFPSEESVVTSFITTFSLASDKKQKDKDFKIIFPEDVKPEEDLRKLAVATSSELITETQDKFNKQKEENEARKLKSEEAATTRDEKKQRFRDEDDLEPYAKKGSTVISVTPKESRLRQLKEKSSILTTEDLKAKIGKKKQELGHEQEQRDKESISKINDKREAKKEETVEGKSKTSKGKPPLLEKVKGEKMLTKEGKRLKENQAKLEPPNEKKDQLDDKTHKGAKEIRKDDKGKEDTKGKLLMDDISKKDHKGKLLTDDKDKKVRKEPLSKEDKGKKDTKEPSTKEDKGKKETKELPSKDDKRIEDIKVQLSKDDKGKKDTKEPPLKDDKGKKDTKDTKELLSKEDKSKKHTKESLLKDDKDKKDTKEPPLKDEKGKKDTKITVAKYNKSELTEKAQKEIRKPKEGKSKKEEEKSQTKDEKSHNQMPNDKTSGVAEPDILKKTEEKDGNEQEKTKKVVEKDKKEEKPVPPPSYDIEKLLTKRGGRDDGAATKLFSKALDREAHVRELEGKMRLMQSGALEKAKQMAMDKFKLPELPVGEYYLFRLAASEKPRSSIGEGKMKKRKLKEFNLKRFKVRGPSYDDLILKLIKKKSNKNEKTKGKITKVTHGKYKIRSARRQLSLGSLSIDSDLLLEIESLTNVHRHLKCRHKIKHTEIVENKPDEAKPKLQPDPILYEIVHNKPDEPKQVLDVEDVPPPMEKDVSVAKGVVRYALSDRRFIKNGWTVLPTEKVVRKMNIYKVRPAQPQFDWFNRHKIKGTMTYESGEKLAVFDDVGRGRWYYRNGSPALDYYDSEEINTQQRYVIYSDEVMDEKCKTLPVNILATFDFLGNGVVYDHSGNIRIKYNQTEGVVLDRSLGPYTHWKWHALNDPPELQLHMINTNISSPDPNIMRLGPDDYKIRPDDEEMLAIELDNFVKKKTKKQSQKFQPFQIKMKALKINDNFSLKIIDQAHIYLNFKDGATNIKLNLGMVLDHQEIIDTDTAEVGQVANSLERFPPKTHSILKMQDLLKKVRHCNRVRTEHALKIRPTVPSCSADRLVSAISKPLRPPLCSGYAQACNVVNAQRKPSAMELCYINDIDDLTLI